MIGIVRTERLPHLPLPESPFLGCSVNDQGFPSGPLDLLDFMREAAGVGRPYHRHRRLTPVAPIRRRRLWVQVNHRCIPAGLAQGHRQVQGKRGLTGPAFLVNHRS